MSFFLLCINLVYFFLDINECIGFFCIYGICIDEIVRYLCSCDILFIGDNCEKGIFLIFNVLIFFWNYFKKNVKLFIVFYFYFCLYF